LHVHNGTKEEWGRQKDEPDVFISCKGLRGDATTTALKISFRERLARGPREDRVWRLVAYCFKKLDSKRKKMGVPERNGRRVIRCCEHRGSKSKKGGRKGSENGKK